MGRSTFLHWRFRAGRSGHFHVRRVDEAIAPVRVRRVDEAIAPGAWRVHREVRTASVVLLPCAPASVAVARRVISDELRAAGIFDSAVCDTVLVVSELLSNAIRHAYPLPGEKLQLSWEIDGTWVEVAVSDGGSATMPHAGQAPVSALGGRGLSIVAHLSDAWGIRTCEPGLTVWAVLRAPRYDGAGGTEAPAEASRAGAAARMAADGGRCQRASEA